MRGWRAGVECSADVEVQGENRFTRVRGIGLGGAGRLGARGPVDAVNGRNQSLDVLRGLAVLAVIFNHTPCLRIMRAGWVGVDLFFVLSGFLISGLLFRDILYTGRVSVGRFLIRRGFKIYPPLIVFLGLTALISSELRRSLWIEALFLQNYIVPRMAIWDHTWSLAVEEHFYLALPFVLVGLVRLRRLRLIPWISLGLIVGCFLLRLRAVFATQLLGTHLRIDGLFAGVALGWLYHFERERFLRLSTWLAGAVGFCLIAISVGLILWAPLTAFRMSCIYTLNLSGFALLLAWAVERNLHLGQLAEIGRYSYSIYLWHLPVALACGSGVRHSHLAPFGAFAVCLVISLAIGVAMAEAVELPMLKVRERLFPAKAEAVQLGGPIPAVSR